MRLAAGLSQTRLAAMEPTSKGEFCTKFGYLTLRKIINFVDTRRQFLGIKCTKFNYGWALPQTPLGQLTALPRAPS